VPLHQPELGKLLDPVGVIGVYAPSKKEGGSDMVYPDYLTKHRITAKEQAFIVSVYNKPVQAAIDPRYLLVDLKIEDNVRKINF
jgi:hypothetical protein